MRRRTFVLACALAMLGNVIAAGLASAAPHRNRNLTIAAAPDPVPAGDAVLIYGRLLGPHNGGQTIRLFHHIARSPRPFTPVASTTTDAGGYYEFTRAAGIVYTNRDWFVRGPIRSHSRMIHERVIPQVSISASTATVATARAIVFSGHMLPNHRFERVFLQQQVGSSDDWRTLRSTTLGPGSNYFIAYRWRRPGIHEVRVRFRGDARNVAAPSDVLTVTIEQAQVPAFTINSSDPIVDYGSGVTVTGILDQPHTGTPQPNTLVQLWGKHADQRRFTVLADTTTGSDGSYWFTQSGLTANTTYYVATMRLPHTPRRHTARLYQGVRDAVSMHATSTSANAGQPVTFSGTVLPGKAGHLVHLQMLGSDGDWHTVQLGIVAGDSTFRFTWTAGSPGTQAFRARIMGDKKNVGATSSLVQVTVTAPAASALPGAS